MKKCLLTILLLLAARTLPSCLAQAEVPAQEDPAVRQARRNQVEAFKVAYINEQLNLTPQESTNFWPLYNLYQIELRHAISDHPGDELGREEAVLNIRKKYAPQFSAVLGRQRGNNVFEAERQFNGVLLRQLHNRNNPNRIPPQRMPMNRKGFR